MEERAKLGPRLQMSITDMLNPGERELQGGTLSPFTKGHCHEAEQQQRVAPGINGIVAGVLCMHLLSGCSHQRVLEKGFWGLSAPALLCLFSKGKLLA